MSITFKKLIEETPVAIHDRAKSIRVTLLSTKPKRVGNLDGRVFTFTALDTTTFKKKKKPGAQEVKVWFQFPDDKKELKKIHLGKIPIRVGCSGKWFNFALAYVLQTKKALLTTKKFSRAVKDAPKIKNPAEVPYACKHLVAVYNFLRNRLE